MASESPTPASGIRPSGRTAPAPRQPPSRSGPPAEQGQSWQMILLRYVLPGVVAVAGLVFMALGTETDLEGGGGLVSAGIAIFFINWLFRAGARGDEEREAEDRAREYFDRHGRWPS